MSREEGVTANANGVGEGMRHHMNDMAAAANVKCVNVGENNIDMSNGRLEEAANPFVAQCK